MSDRRPSMRVGRLAAVMLSLFLALALAEFGLRVAGRSVGVPRLPLSYDLRAIDQIAAGQAYIMFDADVGWLPTPNVDRRRDEVRYRHNQAGLRADQEYTPTPRPGVRRISAYGDSFTYCDDVVISDCWTRRLQEFWRSTEVLNFGVPGYAPDQAFLRYQRDGATWRPCAVLIGHMVENIRRVVNRFRPFYNPDAGAPLAKPRFVQEPGGLVLLPSAARHPDDLRDPNWVETNLGPRDAWYFPGTFVANPFDGLQTVNLARTALYRSTRRTSTWGPGEAERLYQPGTEAFDVLVGVLVEFARWVRVDGATPVVLVFPRQRDIETQRDGGPMAHAPLLDALRQHDIAFIDLTEGLAERARRDPIETLVAEHYRPPGNDVVARVLRRQLPGLVEDSCSR